MGNYYLLYFIIEMKARAIIALLLIAIMMFLDVSEARRSSGGSRSSGSSRSYGGGSRSSGGRTTTTTSRTIRRSNGSSFSGSRIYGSYMPYGGYALIPLVPYYDPHYRYYYDGAMTYRQTQPMNPIVAIIISVIVIGICCVCCFLNKGNMRFGDYEDEYVEETVTTTVHHDDGPAPTGQVYAPGTNPPGTALCNSGHIFSVMYNCPYPDDTATCDNCQGVIQWQMGGYHCNVCEVDLCTNCGQGRVSPAGPPGGYMQ